MSLSVYLVEERKIVTFICTECGHEDFKIEKETIFEANITHNLYKMASEAGIYEILWRPEEVGVVKAKDIIKKLSIGLTLMIKDPERFKKFNSPNGWGTYDNFIPWVEKYLKACKENPDAIIEVYR